ncbi:MAG: C25 family cysteine peptidase [Nitrososphaerales archaeon]
MLLISSGYLQPAYAAQEAASTAIRIRIGVVKDGITVLAPANLSDAGIDPNSVDPRTFALSSLGQPVAIYVTGADDGRFDGADRMYFFGQKFRGPEMDQKYTDERVYWLDTGGAPGLRMKTVDATPRFDLIPPADFATTLHAEESLLWWSLYSLDLAKETQDTWFWRRLQFISGSSITATLPYTVPYPANAAATLRLEEISNARVPGVNPDHRTKAALNGTTLLDETWDDWYVRKGFSAAVPAGVLTHGVNTLAVGAWTLAGTFGDDIYVNYWELDYRRLFQAWEDRLAFRAEAGGTQEYAVTGFSSPDVWIWDVTDTNAPVRLLEPSGWNGRFRASSTPGSRYWMQGAGSFQAPASVRLRPPTGLRDPAGGADAVIVTSAELRSQAERLAGWHRAHGRRALVVDIQDAYDEFNDGVYHPKAVQAMMKWASTHWAAPAPAYLTLFGDGQWNFKNYNPAVYPGGPNHVPPYLAFEDEWQGEVPVDARFGDLNDDKLPEIAVGRIAVNTVGEATTVVDKILAYDENRRLADWQERAIFVADNADVNGDFPAVSDEMIAGYTPGDLQVTRVYVPNPPTPEGIAATKNALINAWNGGAFMVQYTGHGAPERWTHEFILTTPDITGGAFTNGDRLPVVLTFNCLDGYFAHPTQVSIAEAMQRAPGGGSIAAISPSGLGTTDVQREFRIVLLTVMFHDNVREIGRALTIAKQRFAQVYGAHYLTQTMMLFGDPALQLPAGPSLPEGQFKNYLPSVRR